MATHEQNIKNLQDARKGEQVRGSMIELFEEDHTYATKFITVGNDVTSEDSSTEGFYEGMLYLNETTNDLWKCLGDSWELITNLKGDKGETGDKGDKGDTGEKGETGDEGPKGETGDRGNDWFTGTELDGTSSNISGAEGIVGDLYLNTVNNNVYKCVVSGTSTTAKWNYITNIKGSQGAGSGDMDTSRYAPTALSEGLNNVVDSALTLHGLTKTVEELNNPTYEELPDKPFSSVNDDDFGIDESGSLYFKGSTNDYVDNNIIFNETNNRSDYRGSSLRSLVNRNLFFVMVSDLTTLNRSGQWLNGRTISALDLSEYSSSSTLDLPSRKYVINGITLTINSIVGKHGSCVASIKIEGTSTADIDFKLFDANSTFVMNNIIGKEVIFDFAYTPGYGETRITKDDVYFISKDLEYYNKKEHEDRRFDFNSPDDTDYYNKYIFNIPVDFIDTDVPYVAMHIPSGKSFTGNTIYFYIYEKDIVSKMRGMYLNKWNPRCAPVLPMRFLLGDYLSMTGNKARFITGNIGIAYVYAGQSVGGGGGGSSSGGYVENNFIYSFGNHFRYFFCQNATKNNDASKKPSLSDHWVDAYPNHLNYTVGSNGIVSSFTAKYTGWYMYYYDSIPLSALQSNY